MKLKATWIYINRWYFTLRKKWLKKRIPANNHFKLNINNTFILPSKFGWSVIGIAASLFVLGTNFQNNTILLLCYFLIACILLSVFHSFFFFTQHTISFLSIKPDFENRQFHLPISVAGSSSYQGGYLHFSLNANNVHFSSLLDNDSTKRFNATMAINITPDKKVNASTIIKLSLPALKRGIHNCPQITLLATYGFGLFKCWTHLTPMLEIVVYPSMQKSALTLHQSGTEKDMAQSSDSQYVISDNLQGIREYQTTDPIHHVSWKHVAKGQGMLTKDFTENKGVSGWLKIDDFKHVNSEEALRCLCYQIQQLDKDHVQFGLDLGKTQILPQQGSKHVNDCLLQLALFEVTSQTTGNSA